MSRGLMSRGLMSRGLVIRGLVSRTLGNQPFGLGINASGQGGNIVIRSGATLEMRVFEIFLLKPIGLDLVQKDGTEPQTDL